MSTEFVPTKVAIGPGEMYRGRFEYRVESRPRSVENAGCSMSGNELAGWLNELGARGWQLCSVVQDEYGWSEFMFKRELPWSISLHSQMNQ